jgi:DNA/RNA-binding domain of Phe-tRNA-synthetase-like protein
MPVLPALHCTLPGWCLYLARLETATPPTGTLEAAIEDVVDRLADRVPAAGLPALAPVAAVRRLFRQAGTDPTRYRPASEGLARRVLKGGALPRIAPVVELTNLLELELLLPASAVAPTKLEGALEFRAGRPGERMDSLRGPLNLEAKPCIADHLSPFASPITDGRRAAVKPADHEALLVVYVPAALRPELELEATLDALVQASGAARVTEATWIETADAADRPV